MTLWPMLFNLLLNFIFGAIIQSVDLQKGVDSFNFAQNFKLSRIINLNINSEPIQKTFNGLDIELTSRSAVSVDGRTGKILFNKNAEEIAPVASITKLMTALVFLDNNPGWENHIEMLEIDEMNGDAPDIYRGEVVTIKDLFYTSLIASDNNATTALARSTGLSWEEFINQMNEKASDLNLINTFFIEPTGLKDENRSTALDLARLAYFAFQKPEISEVTGLQSYSIRIINANKDRKIYSTDKLLSSTSLNVKAGKTGYLDEAGGCLVVQAENKDGNDIIAVALGSEDREARFEEVEAIVEWTFESYEWGN